MEFQFTTKTDSGEMRDKEIHFKNLPKEYQLQFLDVFCRKYLRK